MFTKGFYFYVLTWNRMEHIRPSESGYSRLFQRKGQGLYTVIDWEKNFADSHRHWAEHEIRELASSLIIRGVSDGLFAPEADLTRAQFMAMLVRGLGLSKHSFSGRVGRLNSFRLLFLRECQHG